MSVLEQSNKIRLSLIDSVRRDLIGPVTGGPYVEFYRDTHKLEEQDEVFVGFEGDTPTRRYGVGKLVSKYSPKKEDRNIEEEEGDISKTARGKKDLEADNEDPILRANALERSAFGLTFRVPEDATITVTMNCGIYVEQKEKIELLERGSNDTIQKADSPDKPAETWWRRKELKFPPWETALKGEPIVERADGTAQHRVSFQLTKRRSENGIATLTLTATNITPVADATAAEVLYQCELQVSTDKEFTQLRERVHRDRDDDQQLMDLLYRKNTIHAMGHGCAVIWEHNKEGSKVNRLRTDFLPVHSIPAVVPRESGNLAMWELSNGTDKQVFELLNGLVSEYKAWVTEYLTLGAAALSKDHAEAAERNVLECELTLERMNKGLTVLRNNADALKCFRWMNEAMLWQQQRSKVDQRDWTANGITAVPNGNNGERGETENSFRSLEEFHQAGRGRWRPFQLAFVLMNLPAMWDPTDTDRDMVDLIWFPTGGGKTEAYLGLAAFTMFARRKNVVGANGYGTAIIMRYTLRLLTTQQFERGASLIMACELIRRRPETDLGIRPFSIGLWVGGSTTPINNTDAVSAYTLNEYPFALLKCPCCGARFGKREFKRNRAAVQELKGVEHQGTEVVFRCHNSQCESLDGMNRRLLPIYVVNQQIYDHTPTLVIGTVDMFGQVPWKSQHDGREHISRLFGFRDDTGVLTRIKPPELIIQDELHLISGPLGSMVGMYETLIQELCTDHGRHEHPFHAVDGDPKPTPPKIVASSATIARANEQVRGLYGKTGKGSLQVFPPQGLDIGETWFSEVDRDILANNPGLHERGRWYVGMCPPAGPAGISGQSTVYRTYGSVIARHYQESLGERTKEREKSLDYYRTLIGFYNSTKELGRSNTMMSVGGNLPGYLTTKAERELIPGLAEKPLETTEIYSSNSSEEISERLKKLERRTGTGTVVDVCLATNMIATGLDVSRLGLMFIHGQPKTTAEYIQASSRVGRSYGEGPGLVFMHYSSMKPRDLSVFEHFSSYHERIYAQVEPTSVTSYSIRVREKAIHAILHGLIRHFSSDLRHIPGPISEELKTFVMEVITRRAKVVLEDDTEAITQITAWLERLCRDLSNLQEYGDMRNTRLRYGTPPRVTALMASDKPIALTEEDRTYCLPTPITMRSVEQGSTIDIINRL